MILAIAALFASACVPNYVPFYTTSKVEAIVGTRKQQEINFYERQFKERRIIFERELDAFYVNSLRIAEEQGLLTAKGVTYLNEQEADLREQFTKNEREAAFLLEENLKFYDDIIEAQKMIRNSIIEEQKENAAFTERLLKELEEFAQMQMMLAPERRRSYNEQIEEGVIQAPELPDTTSIVITGVTLR